MSIRGVPGPLHTYHEKHNRHAVFNGVPPAKKVTQLLQIIGPTMTEEEDEYTIYVTKNIKF